VSDVATSGNPGDPPVAGGAVDAPAAEQLLTIDTATRAGAVIITVVGEVDLMTAPRLGASVRQALQQPFDGPVVIDLSRVTFLDSSGLRALLEAHSQADRAGEPLRIFVDHQRPVIRPLEATGLDKVLMLYHSLDEALNPAHEE